MDVDASQPGNGPSADAPLDVDVNTILLGDERSAHAPIMVDDVEMASEVGINVLMVDDQKIEHSIPVIIPLDADHRNYIPRMPHRVNWASAIFDWDMTNYLVNWECFNNCPLPQQQFRLFKESHVTTPHGRGPIQWAAITMINTSQLPI
jgi:hypothetical protein